MGGLLGGCGVQVMRAFDSARPVQTVDDLGVEDGMVALEGQDVVSALVDDLLGDGLLSAHGVDGHDGIGQVQHLQQCRNCGDLIGLRGASDLGEYQLSVGGPGIHQMNGGRPIGRIAASPSGFAIDSDDLPEFLGLQGLRPTGEAAGKGLGLESTLIRRVRALLGDDSDDLEMEEPASRLAAAPPV
jgi:hypothetical protein